MCIRDRAKAIGLTERETAERDALRKEYLADMRAAFKQQLDSTYVQTADGAKIPYAAVSYTHLVELQSSFVVVHGDTSPYYSFTFRNGAR